MLAVGLRLLLTMLNACFADRSNGLKAAERTDDASDKAWAMRRALDAVLELIEEHKDKVKQLIAGAPQASPLIAAVLQGRPDLAAARLAAGDDVDWCATIAELWSHLRR